MRKAPGDLVPRCIFAEMELKKSNSSHLLDFIRDNVSQLLEAPNASIWKNHSMKYTMEMLDVEVLLQRVKVKKWMVFYQIIEDSNKILLERLEHWSSGNERPSYATKTQKLYHELAYIDRNDESKQRFTSSWNFPTLLPLGVCTKFANNDVKLV